MVVDFVMSVHPPMWWCVMDDMLDSLITALVDMDYDIFLV